ncbi:MAG: mecR [Planctomycetota bacterium]|nr:mecR [Planctomycetota bacterium]
MDSAVETFNLWGAAWASFMARALVDSTVLLLAVVVLWLPFRKRMSAQFAHGLFLLVLLKLAVPIPVNWAWTAGPSLRDGVARISDWATATPGARPAASDELASQSDGPIVVEIPAPEPIVVAPPARVASRPVTAAHGDAATARVRPSLSVSSMLLALWAGVAGLLLARFGVALRNTRRLLREAVPLGDGSGWFPVDLDGLRRDAGVRSPVRWAVSEQVMSPAVGGLIHPTVVLPPDLEDGLTPKQLKWVLLHELAHIRRRDLWVVTVQRLIQAVFFFHPAVHLANWILDQLREYACDDAALSASHASRRDCGEGFLTVVGRTVDRVSHAPAASLGLFESRMLIRRRLVRILDNHRKVHSRLSVRATVMLVLVALIVLPYGRVREAAADLAERNRLRNIESADEPRLFATGTTFLHDDRLQTAGQKPRTVLVVAYSPDGRLLASAGEDSAIIVRDVASGAVRARLEGHRDPIACVVFSPDGKTLASAGYDRIVRLWDVSTGRLRAVLPGHENWVFALAYSPDGHALASAGSDKTVRMWDADSGRLRSILRGHTSAVRAVAFSPDGRTLASAGADRVAILWELSGLLPRSILRGHSATIRALAFMPGGTSLATAGEDGEIKLWEPRSGRERATLTGHSDMVLGLAFSPRGETLASAGLDATVKLWDPKTGRERATLASHGEAISSIAFAPGARQIASAGYDGTITLWEPAAPILSASATLELSDEAWAIAFTPDGKSLLTSGKADTVSVFDPSAAIVQHQGFLGSGPALAVSPLGRAYASGGLDGKIRLVETTTGRLLVETPAHRGRVQSVAFAPDGKTLASGGVDGNVCHWDAASLSILKTLGNHASPVTAVQFAPDGRSLAVAIGDGDKARPGEVAIYDLVGTHHRRQGHGHSLAVESIAFRPDGRQLASAGADGLIKIWDPKTLVEISSIKHTDCRSIAFSPDGRVLVSGQYSGDLVLWNAENGRKLATLKGHDGLVSGLSFRPDGQMLASAGKDKTVRLWNLAARRVAPRASFRGELGCLGPVAVSPDGKTLAVAEFANDSSGDIALWDLATRRVLKVLQGHESGVVSIAFSPDGKTLASSSRDHAIRLWNAETGVSKGEFTSTEACVRLAFSPDGTILAGAGEDKVLTLWDLETGAERAHLDGFRGRLYSVAFSPDGHLIATAGGDRDGRKDAFGEVKVFDVESRAEVSEFTGHTGSVLSIAFSPDGKTLISGGGDSTVRLWDMMAGSARLSLGGFPDCVRALAVSPDGKTLAVAGRGDGVVTLFEASSGGEVARLVGHSSTVFGLTFSPDGRTLATAGRDRTTKLWDVPAPGDATHRHNTR